MSSNGGSVHMRSLRRGSRAKIAASANIRNATPSPAPQPDEGPVGSWLCDDGPYRRYIEALSSSNPGLIKSDPNNSKAPHVKRSTRVALLDAPALGQPTFSDPEWFTESAKLREHLKNSSRNHSRRRIYLMEGLGTDFVSVIGGHFFMEPTFFQRQERTCVWSNEFTPVSDALPQPSLLNPDRSFHLQYMELRQFDKALETTAYFCQQTRRHTGMTAPRHKEETTTGILRRKISWWCRETTEKGWDVVILCDPQLEHLSPDPKEVIDGELRPIEEPHNNLKNSPFQGGYPDFIPPKQFDVPPSEDEITALGKTKHPHKSMMDDLIHYYKNHAALLTATEWEKPQRSALFLKKIVAAHYLQLVDYIKVMLPSLELRLTTAWVEEQDQWKSLQTISRRCGNFRDDIEDTLLSLGYPVEATLGPSSVLKRVDWKDDQKDLQYVYFRLKILKERADNLTTSMTGLASIAGNRQALEEAKRVKRLNILALLFIPLAYTSSLFSMQDDYAPNGSAFWVYWVAAIAVVAFTSLVTFVLDRALDEEANWTLRPVRYLKFWKRKRKIDHDLKKRKTGLYANMRS
ncbi:hypothetical protein BKA63DRAFT_288237 [Paraphoma chrysanthemicola]|nr:hypothetical protein BKA63DRAFT_288237 [Paraphoma chrysanthemicola]